jgi:aminopeptidase YwaD
VVQNIPEPELDSLQRHVHTLAVAPRPRGSRPHEQARRYIQRELESYGLEVRPEPFRVVGADGTNLIVDLPPHRGEASELLIVGAHYDSIPSSPGADDNASAVAALLEIARVLAATPESLSAGNRCVRLIFFDLEEEGMLGSTHHAQKLSDRQSDLAGMVSLEMLAYTDHAPGSQGLPPALAHLYPDAGDFIGLVGNERSGRLLENWTAALKQVPRLPVESLAVLGNGEVFPETRLSDHSPFWDLGYAALMVTDTSFFRNPHYHQPSDTPETLDFGFLVRVTEGIVRAILD